MERNYELFLKLSKHICRKDNWFKCIHLNVYSTFINGVSKLKKLQSRIQTHFLFLEYIKRQIKAGGQIKSERQRRKRDRIRELRSLREKKRQRER